MVPLISVKRADPGARFCPQQSLAGLTVTTHCVQCSGARFCPQQSLNDSLQLLTACNAPSKEKRIQEPWFSFPHLFVSRLKTSVVKSGGNQKGEGGLSGRFYKPKDYVNEISNTIPLTDCYFCLKELQNWIKNRLFWFFSFPPDEINLVLFPFYSEGWILNLVFHLKIVNNFVNNFLSIILKVINNQITNWNWKLWIETFFLNNGMWDLSVI